MGWKPSLDKAMQCRQTEHRILSYITLSRQNSHSILTQGLWETLPLKCKPMIFSRIWKASYIGSYLLVEPGAECGWLQCAGLLRILRLLRILSTDVWCGVLPRASHRPPQHLPHPRISGRKLELQANLREVIGHKHKQRFLKPFIPHDICILSVSQFHVYLQFSLVS